MNMNKLFLTSTILVNGVAFIAAPSSFASAMRAPLLQPQQSALSTLHIEVTTNLESAQSFVNTIAEQGIGFLSNTNISKEQQILEFKKLLKNNFDMRTIARFALGRYWKSASPAQQNEYMTLFEKMVLNVYAKRFEEYQGQALVVNDARPEGNSDILVHSTIEQPGGNAPIKVDWRIRNKNGSNKVIDVIVEGVSMSLTQRSDFSSVIQRGGGDINVLLEHLRNQ